MALTVAQLVARLSADTSGFYKGMAIANASLVRTGGIVKKVAAGAGLATVAMGYMALTAAGDFQQSMNVLQAVSEATTNQLGRMRKEAIALGEDFKLPNTSAKDAADAMVELSKGGLSVNQILTATRGTIQLSLASNEDLATSAMFVARSLKAFGLGGSHATEIANLMAAAANKSTAEMSDLELGVQNASAQFSGAGYKVQTLAVALAELADRGLNGSIAGTSLKYMLQRLENPTTAAAAALAKFNFHLADSKGHILPLRDIIGQFSRGLANQTQVQKQQTLNTIFGQRANAAMFKLVQGGTSTWDSYTKKIVGTNAAQKMAEARTKGFNGAMGALNSAFSTFLIKIGTPLLGPMERAIRAVARFIESVNTDAMIKFGAGVAHLIGRFVDFAKQIPHVGDILKILLAGFLAFEGVAAVTAIITLLTGAFTALNAAMFANPVGLVVGAIAALAVGFYLLYQRSETFRNIIQSIWSFLKGPFVNVFIAIKNAVVAAAHWVASAFRDMKAVVVTQTGGIRLVISAAWSVITGLFRTFMTSIKTIWSIGWPILGAVVKTTWAIIKTVVMTGLRQIRDIVNIVMGLLRGDWGRAWRGLKSLVRDTLSGIGTLTSNVLHGIVNIAYTAAKSIGSGIIHGIIDGVKGLAGDLAGAVKGAVTGAIGGLAGHLGIHSPSTVTRDKIGKPLAAGIIEGFLLGIRDLPEKMNSSLRSALERGQQIVSAQLSLFQDKFSRFSDYVNQAFDAISAAHLGPKGSLLQKLITQHDQAQLKDQLNQANQSVADAQKQLIAAQGATYDSAQSRAEAIAQAEKALTDAIAQQKEAQYQIRIAKLQKEADEEDKQYQARRNLQKQHLDDLLANFEKQMQRHPERAAFWQHKITETLRKYGITYQSAGAAMGDAFALGLRQSEHAIEAEIKKIARIIERYLRLHSPAETGPLSSLHQWWAPFAGVLTSGLDPSVVRSAALGMADASRVPYQGGSSAGLARASAAGGMAAPYQIVVPVSGNTFLTNERETLRAISDALAKVSPNSDSRLQLRPA